MKLKQLPLILAFLISIGYGPPVWAETTTVKGLVIVDKTEVDEGDSINLSLLGLNQNGEVDRFGEANGSTIMAVINTINGEIRGGSSYPGATPTDVENPGDGYFASQVRYVKLNQGLGRVNIDYSCDAIESSDSTTDTVTVTLQERIPSAGGGVEFSYIGQPITKTITVNNSCGGHLVRIKPTITSVTANPDDPQGNVEQDVQTVKDDETGENVQVDRFIAFMTAGIGGTEIKIEDENFGKIRRLRASGDVRVELKLDGNVERTFNERFERGEATITLTEDIIEAAEYDMDVIAEDNDGEEVEAPGDHKLVVLPSREARGLRISGRRRITMPDASLFDADGYCQIEFPALQQICDGSRISITVLDEYGNETSETETEAFMVSLLDGEGVVNDKALKFQVAAGAGEGVPVLKNIDARLGNQKDEILKLGTASLVAKASNENVPDSEPLEIEVVKDALIVELIDDSPTKMAGTEFEAFQVRVANGAGQIYLKDPRNVVDYDDVADQETFDPGLLKVENAAEERYFRRADKSDIVPAYFEKATDGYSYYVISDDEDKYPYVDDIFAWEIIPAAVTDVRWADTTKYTDSGEEDDTTNDDNTVNGEENDTTNDDNTVNGEEDDTTNDDNTVNGEEDDTTNDDNTVKEINPFKLGDQYRTTIDFDDIEMFDDYGNQITRGDRGFMVAKTEQGVIQYPGREFFNLATDSSMVVSYDANFSGKNTIELSFNAPGLIENKPGLKDKKLTVISNIPKDEEEKDITYYIENTSPPTDNEVEYLPLDSEVPMIVKLKNLEKIWVFFNEQEGDNLTPNLSTLGWKDVKLNAQACQEAGGTVDVDEDNLCQLTETQCQALGYVFMDEQCQEQTETRISAGNELTATRNLLVINAGSQEGQFSLTFTNVEPAAIEQPNTIIEKYVIFNVTRQASSSSTEEPGTGESSTEEPGTGESSVETQCVGEGNYWDGDQEDCIALPPLNNPVAGEKSAVLSPDGELVFTSNARFQGGIAVGSSDIGNRLTMALTEDGSEILCVGNIQFDTDDVGETVDIVVAMSYQLNPLWVNSGTDQTFWMTYNEDGDFSLWDMEPANLDPFQSDYLIEDDASLSLTVYQGTLTEKEVVPGIINIYLGYRLKNDQVKFGLQPMILDMY